MHILYGRRNDVINNTNLYFINSYYEPWLEKDESKQMVKDIDNSILESPNLVISPILGAISPRDLSGGVKALILVSNEPDKMFNITSCGENCAPWLLKLAEDRDIYVNLRYMMNFGKGPFEIEVMNTNKIVTNMTDLVFERNKFIVGE